MANKYTSLINEKNIFCANVRENVKVNNCFLAHLIIWPSGFRGEDF
jgi:hypothetical protein